MKTIEYGVAEASNVYIHTASYFARDTLYYLLHVGLYYCDAGYMVERNAYIGFLIIIVIKGRGYVKLGDKSYELCEGEITFIDCTKPHIFGTDSKWEILWMHFDGAQTRKIHEEVTSKIGNIILPRDVLVTRRPIEKIFEAFHMDNTLSEVIISKYIYNVLTELLVSLPDHKGNGTNDTLLDLEKILVYIQENLMNNITVKSLATFSSISQYHFIRVFKSNTGYTPHEYIISSRINLAKRMLRSTHQSINYIANCCGFSSNSSFSVCFKRVTGMSPVMYRKNEQ